MKLRLPQFIFIPIAFFSIACSPSLPFIGIDPTFDFSQCITIAVYIHPSGNDVVDSRLRNVVGLDFTSRGYRVTNIYPKSIPSRWTVHQAIAETLLQKSNAHYADLLVIARPQIDSVEVNRRDYKGAHYRGNSFQMDLELTIFDKASKRMIVANQSVDTMRWYSTQQFGERYNYQEPLHVLIERSVTKVLRNFPLCSVEYPQPPSLRVPIVVLVDESYRTLFRDWKNRLQRRLLFVNDIFRSQLNMEFEVKEYRRWNTQFSISLENALDRLRKTSGENDTLYLGVTYDPLLVHSLTSQARIGLAYPLGTHAIVTAQPMFPDAISWNAIEEAITIIHELGHVLGAPHILDESSVMYPQSGAMSYHFDPTTQLIIETTRRDFLALRPKDRLEKYLNTIVQVYNVGSTSQIEIIHTLGRMTEQLIRLTSLETNTVVDTITYVTRTISDSSLAYSVLGYIAFKRHRPETAVSFFLKSIELRPDFSEAFWYISQCYNAIGNKSEAKVFSRRAKELRPNWAIED